MEYSKNFRVKKFIGYVLFISAFIIYKLRVAISQAFLEPTFIVIIAVFLGVFGIILLFSGERDSFRKKDVLVQDLLDRLKAHGEKVTLTPNNCIIVENNYYEEITNHGTDTVTVADALYDPNRNVTQTFVKQSAIIYYYEMSGQKLKLTSQTFPYTKEDLKYYLAAGRVKLYIDRFEKDKYAFELK